MTDLALVDVAPWDFEPNPQTLAELRRVQKDKRRLRMLRPDTEWNIYTAVAAANPHTIVGKDNPPASVRGIVADYDTRMSVEVVLGILNQMPPSFVPNFIEVSIGMKIRLVWVFEKALPVMNTGHAAAVYRTFAEKFKLATLLPGYDANSEKPAERWTNGGEWHTVHENPVPWNLIFGMAADAGKYLSATRTDIPLEKVAAEVEKRWPGRWKGEFKLDALGVRFWDDTADCETGCQVKPDGMLCFTGRSGFLRWEQILGSAWVNEQSALNLSAIAGDTYFDGDRYWGFNLGYWFPDKREDYLNSLSKRGLDSQRRKGQTISDAHNVLFHVQTANRIHGAAPLIYCPKGIVDISGQRILNTTNLRLIEPATGPCTFDDFPFIWVWIKDIFVPVYVGDPLDPRNPLPHWLSWQQRAYIGLRDNEALMGQAIFIFGPTSSGKTLLLLHITRPLLGGRMANPYEFLVGRTTFSDDLFGAALWAINDEESPRDERERAALLAKIKSSVVNPELTYHPKFCKKLSLPWQGRIGITGNMDPHSVAMLIEINEATRDKAMFFAAQEFAGTWPVKREVEARIAKELPFFLRWLLDWRAPQELIADKKFGRMGVRSYFDPGMLAMSNQQSHAFNLKELIDLWAMNAHEFHEGQTTWQGNPTTLLAAMSVHDVLTPLLREWTVSKVARAMTALARVGSLGVQFVPGSLERQFIITKPQPK